MLGVFPPLPNDLLKTFPINSAREHKSTNSFVLNSCYKLLSAFHKVPLFWEKSH